MLSELQEQMLKKLNESSVANPAMPEENLSATALELLAASVRAGKIGGEEVWGRTDGNGDLLVTIRYKSKKG